MADGWPVASFFKLILDPRLDLHLLEIPKKFVKTHGDDLSNIIHLNIPTGELWEFNLETENGKAFLRNGWPEFVEFFSLSHGHCIMFNYAGDSSFNVVIFDKSATEIDYPIDPESSKGRVSKPLMERKITEIAKPRSSKKAEGKLTLMNDKFIIANSCRLTLEEDTRVRTYAYNQCNHPVFVSKMHPSFVDKHSMGVPREFVKRYLNKKCTFSGTLNLRNDTRKSWQVSIVGNSTHVKLTSGWRNFVVDNKLKVDDICVFELIDKQKLKVHIFRVVNDNENTYLHDPQAFKGRPLKRRKTIDFSKPSSSSKKEMQTIIDDNLKVVQSCRDILTPEEKNRVCAYACQCKHPLFVRKMQKSFVQYHFCVGVSKEFVERYLDKERPFSRTFNFQADTGKTWPVTIVGDDTHMKLKMGWKMFALQNKLKVGDICIFEFINNKEFKVCIFRIVNDKEHRR